MQRTRIKICGITRPEDALFAARCGADAIGVVFYPKSPRHVTIDRAREIARALPPFVTLVGLFVDPAADVVRATLDAVPLQVLQFHGDETPEACAALALGHTWMKAARMRPGFDLVEYAARYKAAGACALVLDAYTREYGGAGVAFDWSLIPADVPLPVILAGGLSAANVSEAIQRIQPWAVDVSSGVEPDGGPKGVKDPARIAQFISGVNDASL